MRASEAVLEGWKKNNLVFRAQLQFVGSEVNKSMETYETIKLDFY